jgi:hypothetical protein
MTSEEKRKIKEERKIENEFICDLINLLTKDNDDDMYFKKLLWANEKIAFLLLTFEKRYSYDEESEEN